MREGLLLVDSDMFVILSAAGALHRTAHLLGFGPDDVRRLPALQNQLRRGRTFLRKYTQEIRDAALDCCGRVATLTERPSGDAILDQLSSVSDIDVGEAVMYAVMLDHPSYLLASGDKRAMRALAANPCLSNVRDALAGRVICLEAAVRMLVKRDGVAQVAQAFAPLLSANTALRVAFSEGLATGERNCLSALDSYLRDLSSEVGEDFLLIP